MKRQVTVLQKISANHKSDKGLVSTIYKESSKLNSERQKSMKKWAKDTNRHFTQEDRQMANNAHEKMFKIISH